MSNTKLTQDDVYMCIKNKYGIQGHGFERDIREVGERGVEMM